MDNLASTLDAVLPSWTVQLQQLHTGPTQGGRLNNGATSTT